MENPTDRKIELTLEPFGPKTPDMSENAQGEDKTPALTLEGRPENIQDAKSEDVTEVPQLAQNEKPDYAPAAETQKADVISAEKPIEAKAATAEIDNKELRRRKREYKKHVRGYKKASRAEAKVYLGEKRACQNKDEKKAFKKKWKDRKKQWKSTLKGADKEEKKAQKKGFKAFKKRKKLVSRIIWWVILLAVLAALGYVLAPRIPMAIKAFTSQKYTDTGDAADAARAEGYALSAEICDEGFVLLKNDNDFLPLKDMKVNVFGDDAYNFVYGGSGSAGADQEGATTFFEALEKCGIEYNKDLNNVYSLSDEGETGSLGESIAAFLGLAEDDDDWKIISDDEMKKAKEYSDTAVIVLSSQEVEGSEIDIDLLKPMKEGTNKAYMIDKVCSYFDNVILIINSGNVMELGFTDNYDSVKSVLWVGAPGSEGTVEIARVLKGEVNPSGRCVDTWPAGIESEPSYQEYGDNKYKNLDLHLFNYSEGIYVGYRYYETRYGESEKEYADNVVYPFGHGLSYTTFKEEIKDFSCDGDNITVEVKVTNTGKTAGKDVVELYFMAPYNEESGIEKSAIELAGFAKTDEIKPLKSDTVTISFPVRDMSSYSMEEECYILEKGDYKIAIGSDVHDALLTDDFATYTAKYDVKYTEDDTTGTEIKNLFTFAKGDVTYMSRSDFEGTFPEKKDTYKASDDVIAAKKEYESEVPSADSQTLGEDNGLKLEDLKGKDYDDEAWDKFLDQFTIDELITLTANGGWHSEGIERLGIPSSHLLDGPSGINSMFSSLNAVAYPMETVISSSWNTDLAAKFGEVIANEADAYGVDGWYAPAMNIHRSSIGGRNSEYYSEDPLLAGKMAAATIKSAQDNGLFVYMKHLVCNDVELNARSDVAIWVNEQALREIYLRPFEYAVKEGGASGAMSSFSRLGVKWCGASDELLKDLLRTEWGFEGMVTTDAVLGTWMDVTKATANGNDLMLEMGLMASESKLEKAYEENPNGTVAALKESAHNICYVLSEYVQ